jgi:hypothetical protein
LGTTENTEGTERIAQNAINCLYYMNLAWHKSLSCLDYIL